MDYLGCGVFLIGTFLLIVSAILNDNDNKSGLWFAFFLFGALACSIGLSLQLLIWAINLFMGGANFTTWGVKFYMLRTQ